MLHGQTASFEWYAAASKRFGTLLMTSVAAFCGFAMLLFANTAMKDGRRMFARPA